MWYDTLIQILLNFTFLKKKITDILENRSE